MTPNSTFWPKIDLYKSSSAITPLASKLPFIYKITTKNKNTDIQLFVKYGFMNGSTKVKIGPDKSGVYQVKRVTFYDGSGKKWYGFVPPAQKPKPIVSMSVIPPPTSTSTRKPSP